MMRSPVPCRPHRTRRRWRGNLPDPLRKACGNAIHRACGTFIVLSPEGFPEHWHPARAQETLCVAGRMLFLSLWPPQAARLYNATLHRRCHEMGAAIASLGRNAK